MGDPDRLLKILDELVETVDALSFGDPVTHVYNPARYARSPMAEYVRRYGVGPKQILLIGMNPGPWGMAQTGVPFGEVNLVRDWLGIRGPVGPPRSEHPKRPVQGFDCHRSEVSGRRVWGWARERFASPDRFFERFYVHNYCPLMFLEQSGRNRTPDRLPVAERTPLLEACDRTLSRVVEILEPPWVIGVGTFAEARARAALADRPVQVGSILHPSPASPKANRGWARQAEEQLEALGISVRG